MYIYGTYFKIKTSLNFSAKVNQMIKEFIEIEIKK